MQEEEVLNMQETVQFLKLKLQHQDEEFTKLKSYAKAGKHYKERSKQMKSKLQEALDMIEKLEKDKNETVAHYRLEVESLQQ